MSKNRIILIAVAVCQCMLFLALLWHACILGKMDSIITCILGLVIVFCETFYLICKVFKEIDNVYLKEKLQLIEAEEVAFEERNKIAGLLQKENGRIRDELLDKLDGMKSVLAQKRADVEERDRFFEYVNGMEVLLSKTRKKIWCDNTLLNVLIEDKYRIAQKYRIQMDAALNVPQDISINPVDLCSVFSNLLDNALEASGQLEESLRVVELKAAVISGSLVIKIKNPVVQRSSSQNYTRIFKKNIMEPHGIGLKIVENIVTSYRGKLSTQIQDGYFWAIAYIECDKEV